MQFQQPITEVINQRFSCRTYQPTMLSDDHQQHLREAINGIQTGPLGNPVRFELVAAVDSDAAALRGLGTYGFIKGAKGFLCGAITDSGKALEDFGYLMEKLILFAVDMGLGTCWLGGSFTRSRFAEKMSLSKPEIIPAVTSLGYIAPKPGRIDTIIRREARADQRRPWSWMFFEEDFGNPLTVEMAAEYQIPLEMVRLGPSASNLQPWRIIKKGNNWHFYLQRKPGYRDSFSSRILRTADLQRVDLGIAMCHFETTARSLNLPGKWEIADSELKLPNEFTEYTVSWLN